MLRQKHYNIDNFCVTYITIAKKYWTCDGDWGIKPLSCHIWYGLHFQRAVERVQLFFHFNRSISLLVGKQLCLHLARSYIAWRSYLLPSSEYT